MARRKAPQRRCQGASKGSLGNKANPQPAGESAGSSGSPCTEVKLVACVLPSTPSSAAQEPAKCNKATEIARMLFGLACCLPGAFASLGRLLLSTFIFVVPKTASQKKRFLQVILLLAVALAGGYCWTSLPAWSTCAKGLVEELRRVSSAHLETLRNAPALWFKERQNLELLLEKAAQLRAEISGTRKAVSKMAFHVSPEMSDWDLKSSGATIDTQRTSETYSCRETWGCWVLGFFRTANPPDAILQPDVSPGNRWCFQGHQGQVVIRLPAGVHLAAVTVQHIYKEASPSGSVASAPRDFAVFGVDTDREEETLLGIFMYDVTKESIQTFLLKNMPFPRAFSRVKFLVTSNWGSPAYTCIYRVQVHGVMAKPESLD